ncbi:MULTISPECIES: N-acetylmannosamine-6-phosphate 2-epimerase [Paenibacillus]|uniref:Putative N-acetylmannosamine-6-phosphate 2-epimerase n=1 Tax=Paenibacillus campinasensis TaxID=66347 RepID=A0A268EK35_9BACL|nr:MULTISPECIES: N-acetylmannosamine-6-phosphate 2-epimerase [Paenibacillus]PAD73444.1 N-acetylmannosamine-6-phosphate 2-epimerase [Paenibacillus campinasensis]PAK51163.1 N-acetylmannosamine-6-phosphate 2-epimerase [Paenibacillus sp. 7541]
MGNTDRTDRTDRLEQLGIKHKLIVSCQALENEPLHSSFIMGRMALAALQGGASGIRANTAADIIEIKSQVQLPVIGIVKRDYPDSEVYITPTMKEIEELVEAKAEIIALDATSSLRPGGLTLGELMQQIRAKYPDQLLMADVSTVEEAEEAEKLGFDMVGTTLVGYTAASQGQKVYDHDFEIMKNMLQAVQLPVIAEGNILTPDMAKRCLELGAYSVVVGGAITRPQQITARFVEHLNT